MTTVFLASDDAPLAAAATEEEIDLDLGWDLLALALALALATGGDGSRHPEPVSAEPAAFLPSLHLNPADGHRRKGDLALAKDHASTGLKPAGALPDDEYEAMILAALQRTVGELDVNE